MSASKPATALVVPDFFEVIQKRQSIRSFDRRAVEDEKLRLVLEAANRAPSAGNFQAYEIFVVSGDRRRALAGATFDQHFVSQAPVSLVFCMNPCRCEYEPRTVYAMQDATIACTFAMLAVDALRLATCWVGAFNPDRVAEAIGAADGLIPVAILPIGYGAEHPKRTSRRDIGDLVHVAR